MAVQLLGGDGQTRVGGHEAALVRGGVVGERELVSCSQSPRVALGLGGEVVALLLLEPHLGSPFAFAGVHVATGVVIDLEDRGSMLAGLVRLGAQVFRRGLEVEIIERVGAGQQLLAGIPRRDAVPHHGHATGAGIGNLLVLQPGLVATRGVADDHLVPTVLVPEEVEHAFVLHQPADEVEIGLPVLHTVVALLVGLSELECVVAEPLFLQHVVDDLLGVLVLEDAAVGGSGQEPEPGHEHQFVVGPLVVVHAGEPDLPHEPVEVAHFVVRQGQANGGIGAKHIGVGDVRLFAIDIDAVLEQAGHPLITGQLPGEHRIGVEHRFDGEVPFSLGQGRHPYPS